MREPFPNEIPTGAIPPAPTDQGQLKRRPSPPVRLAPGSLTQGGSQTFVLPWPPSVNSIWRAYKGRNILSQRARQWNQTASIELAMQKPKAIKGPVSVSIELSPPSKRAWDLDNRLKICLDILVRSAVIEADDHSIVQALHARVGSGFTGARITITPLGQGDMGKAASNNDIRPFVSVGEAAQSVVAKLAKGRAA